MKTAGRSQGNSWMSFGAGSGWRESNQEGDVGEIVVEMTGFEPATSAVRMPKALLLWCNIAEQNVRGYRRLSLVFNRLSCRVQHHWMGFGIAKV